MGVNLDSSSDNEQQHDAQSPVPAAEATPSDANRRRFTRNALVGSAVLLSLGNRAAWGQAVPDECLSLPTWNSYTPGVGFASLSPNNADKLDKADNIYNKGVDLDTYPGYACPIPDQPAGGSIFTGGPLSEEKMVRQRDQFN